MNPDPDGNDEMEDADIRHVANDADLKDMMYHPLEARFDSESDRYSYNFNGKYGIFAYSHEAGKFVTLNYAPIQIEATVQSNSSYFVAADSDGITYEFKAMEYTGVADDEDCTDVSSWYVTRIETPYGDITFEYENATTYYVYSKSETLWVGHLYNQSLGYDFASFYGTKYFPTLVKHVYRTLLTKSIQWNGNRIDFTYAHDRRDIWPDRLVQMTVKGCDGTVHKTVVFGNNHYFGNSTANYRMMLNSLSVSDEGTYTFTYDNYNENVTGLRLPNYIKAHPDSTEVRCSIDYWGYYNGVSSDRFIPKEVVHDAICAYQPLKRDTAELEKESADRAPRERFTKVGTLVRINYPTGGYTKFAFEQNQGGSNDFLGGLRIRSITSSAGQGCAEQTWNYAYNRIYRLQDAPQKLMSYKAYHWYETNTMANFYTHTNCLSNPVFPLSNSSGSPAYYQTVVETYPDGSRAVYSYTHLWDLRQGLLDKHPSLSGAALHDRGAFEPLLAKKEILDADGNAVRSESYHYEPKELETFEMGTRLVGAITCDKELNFVLSALPKVDDTYVLFRKVTGYSCRSLLATKSVTEDGVTTTESYEYDESLRTLAPQAVTVSGSDGVPYRTEYEYPFERTDDSICKKMTDEYFIYDEVMGVAEYGGGQELSRKRLEYTFVEDKEEEAMPGVGEFGHFYPWKVRESLAGAGLRETARYEDYDERGNPRTIVTDNKDATALLWSYNFQYPVAKVEGCTYPQLLRLAGDAVSSLGGKTGTASIRASLEAIRNVVGGKYPMTAYLYRPLTGPSSIVDGYGHETSYDYHEGSGKLSAVRDASGTLQRFDYNYVKPFNPIQP